MQYRIYSITANSVYQITTIIWDPGNHRLGWYSNGGWHYINNIS